MSKRNSSNKRTLFDRFSNGSRRPTVANLRRKPPKIKVHEYLIPAIIPTNYLPTRTRTILIRAYLRMHFIDLQPAIGGSLVRIIFVRLELVLLLKLFMCEYRNFITLMRLILYGELVQESCAGSSRCGL